MKIVIVDCSAKLSVTEIVCTRRVSPRRPVDDGVLADRPSPLIADVVITPGGEILVVHSRLIPFSGKWSSLANRDLHSRGK